MFLFGFNYLTVSNGGLKSKTVYLKILGMTDQNNAQNIKNILNKSEGVISSDIKFNNDVNTVTYDPAKTNASIIIKTIQKAGYKAIRTDDQNNKINISNFKCGC